MNSFEFQLSIEHIFRMIGFILDMTKYDNNDHTCMYQTKLSQLIETWYFKQQVFFSEIKRLS